MAAESGNSIESIARSLVQRLEGTFHNEGKTSCRACLRSKTLPCSQVVEAASSIREWTLQLIVQTYEILLKEYTTFPMISTCADGEKAITTTSLSYINRAVTVIRFVQLLLHFTERHPSNNDANLQRAAIPSSQCNKMMGLLLQKWTKGIAAFAVDQWAEIRSKVSDNDDNTEIDASIRDYNPMTTDSSTGTIDPRPVFCFAFGSLLRMNDYTNTRRELLVPLWKGLCHLAGVLLDLDDDDNEWRNSLPSSLLVKGIQELGDFLKEGKAGFETLAVQHVILPQESKTGSSVGGSTSDMLSKIAFHGKLVIFMISKLSQLMRVYFKFFQGDSQDGKQQSLMKDMWRTLLGLRGLPMALHLQMAQAHGGQNEESLPFLKVYSDVAERTDKSILEILLTMPAGPRERPENVAQILKSALQSAMRSEMVYSIIGTTRPNNHVEKYSRLVETSRVIGKVLVLQSVLDFSDVKLAENSEPLLEIAENLYSISVPQCFAACGQAAQASARPGNINCDIIPSSIALNSLRSMSIVLKCVESSPTFENPSKRSQLHRLFVRWLAGACPSTGEQHPLARELVLSLIHSYVLTCAKDGNTEYPAKFISFLTKILVDHRTVPILRSNTAALLARLQSSSDSGIHEAAKMSVEHEFSTVVVKELGRHSKKRKRSGTVKSKGLTPEEVNEISCAFRGHGLSDKLMNGATLPGLHKAFSKLRKACYNDSGKQSSIRSLAELNSLLLCFMERFVLSKSEKSLDAFRRIAGVDFFEYLHLVLSSISKIQFATRNCKTVFQKNVLLYSAAMRLSAAICNVSKREMAGSVPLEAIYNLITSTVMQESWCNLQDTFGKAYTSLLEFDAIALLGSLAKVIQRSCAENILQGIPNSFVRLLSIDEWPLTSFGISSIVAFGTSLTSEHNSILRACLPESRMELFRCRVGGRVRRSNGRVESDVSVIMDHIAHLLNRLCATRTEFGTSIFLSAASMTIAPGSYVLEMATQEGRKAMVIFPPDPKSLDDIRYMMGGAEETPAIHTMKRVVPTPSGDIKCLLQI